LLSALASGILGNDRNLLSLGLILTARFFFLRLALGDRDLSPILKAETVLEAGWTPLEETSSRPYVMVAILCSLDIVWRLLVYSRASILN